MEDGVGTASDIFGTYLHFRDDGRVTELPVSDGFWEKLAAGAHPELDGGRLMTAFAFSEPWSTWERHPAGEELVMLLSGSATVVLEEGGRQRTVSLREAGTFLLVPRDTWHTVRTSEPTTILLLTPGAGTQHRPVDD